MRSGILFAVILTIVEIEVEATLNSVITQKLEDPHCQSIGISIVYNTTLILQCPYKPIEWIYGNTQDSKITYTMEENSNTTRNITNIKRKSEGCFCCRSIQDFSVSCVTVEILGPPFLKPVFENGYDLQTHCDKPVDIICPFGGNPTPNFTWNYYRSWDKKVPLPDILKDQINNSILHVDKYSRQIGGYYICIATNIYGTLGKDQKHYQTIITPSDCVGYSQYRSANLNKVYYADIGENITLNCSLRFTCIMTYECLKFLVWSDTSFPINRTTSGDGYRCSSCTVWKTKTIHNLQDSDFDKTFTCTIKESPENRYPLIYNTTIQKRPKNTQTEVLIPSVVPTVVILIILIISAIITISLLKAYKKEITMFLYYRLAKEPPYTQELKNDVFISFASRDIDFVQKKIRDPIDKAGYKVIWYPDDFQLGGLISQEALKSIWSSRKTILCLSQNFLMSKHCKSEKDMCFQKAMKTFQNFLIIIHLDDCDIPTDLKKLKRIEMKQNADNDNNGDYKRAFSKLKYLLKAPIDRMN